MFYRDVLSFKNVAIKKTPLALLFCCVKKTVEATEKPKSILS